MTANPLLYVLMALLILGSGAVIAIPYSIQITALLILLSILKLLLSGFQRKFIWSYPVFIILLVLSIMSTLFINEDFNTSSTYINLSVRILLLSFAILLFSNKMIMECYSNCMLFLALSSFAIFGLILLNQEIRFLAPQIEISGNTYNNFYIYVSSLYEGELKGHYRNQSIFWEAGAFQSLLSLALFFEIFFFKNLRKKNIIIFTVAILTTGSTTGYLVLLALFFIYVFGSDKESKNTFLLKILFFFIMAFFIFYSGFLISNISGKLTSDNLSTISRLISLRTDLQIFAISPLLGNGFSNYDNLVEVLSASIYGMEFEGSVSPLSKQLAVFGVFFMIPILYLYLKLVINMTDNIKNTLIIFGLILLILGTEGFIVSTLWLFLGLSNYQNANERGEINER